MSFVVLAWPRYVVVSGKIYESEKDQPMLVGEYEDEAIASHVAEALKKMQQVGYQDVEIAKKEE